MLAPDSRTVLIDQLRPSLGYSLDAAVATTFTLDLVAALVPPLAFATFHLRGTPDPVAVLEAVRSCADKVDIFCQAGQIRVPAQASDLMAYLEPMVHEVTAARKGFLFHPKLWFLRYVGEGLPDELRLLVLTRNLTPDRSWDAIVRLDGQRGPRRFASNHAVASLLDHLPSRAVTALSRERLDRMSSLVEDARRANWDLPESVTDIAFHLWGVPGQSSTAEFQGFRHLVVAPFCNDKGVERMTERSSHATLVSRIEDLECLQPETLAALDSRRVLDPLAGLTDPADSDMPVTQSLGLLDGLHAKLVVVERNRWAHVFVGSTNATAAALNGNVELMVELTGSTTKLGVEAFLSSDTGLGSLLMEYDATGGREPNPVDQELRALESALRDIAAVPFVLTVERSGERYTAHLESSTPLPIPTGHRATAELLTRPGEAQQVSGGSRANAMFTDIVLPDCTPFIVLRLTNQRNDTIGTVIRARLVNDPPDRLDAVLARQVDTPEKFLRFLALLLGLLDPTAFLGNAAGSSTGLHSAVTGAGSGVLELILRALADQPASLHDLDRLVQRLAQTESGRDVLPEGFEILWAQVLKALVQRPETAR